ncbi:calmodulin binding protein PICBP-like [Mangifera indica]|uniref:calmodulin binding protein PICBP-like n=1 Tax=Mangifera indica TaxID=29780 RepID=UPI001CFAD51E|nr:calmodulin binding protein PICBP-like [Mangifera indica]XP_044493671.1 calmodulin binding protein PICBP-like [Mangifera indica]
MVQRKVSNQLGIQADHVKSEKRLVNMKSSSYQHQDGKNRGPDIKKKMKKSRSIKLSSSTLKQTISQPGKPPPEIVLSVAPAPQKQSPVTSTYGSPNYMKSTSSSEARKENSLVSSRYSQTSFDIKNQHRRNLSGSKVSSVSGTKPARALTKSSSLKMVRTLTKAPTFKNGRGSARKCSRVVLCADMDAQRATCSSTLKDSKFPDYLMLSPGATEAEGTSALKVCPYTYCSLNGHHHTPLPPLKCFLSARRRLLKTQKNKKLEALSPRRVTPVVEGAEGVDGGKVILYDTYACKEGDSDCSPISPLIKEGSMDFFIEIYAKNKEGNGESPFGGCDGAKVEHDNDKQVSQSVSDGSPRSEIDFEENLEQDSHIIPTGVDIIQCFPKEQKVEDPEIDYLPIAAQNEVAPESYYNGSDFEEECSGSSQGNDSISEASDMEWEGGQFLTSDLGTEANYSTKNYMESDPADGKSSDIKNRDFHDEAIIKSDNTVIHCGDEIAPDEVFEEQSACFDSQHDDSDSKMEDSDQNFGIVESSQVIMEEAETDLAGVKVTDAWPDIPIAEPAAFTEELEVKKLVSEAEAETLNDRRKEESPVDEVTYQAATDKDCNGSLEPKDLEIDQNIAINVLGLKKEVPKSETGYQTDEREQVAVTKRSIGVQVDIYPVTVIKVSIGVQAPDDLYEAYRDDAMVDTNFFQFEDLPEDGVLSQDMVDEMLPEKSKEQLSEAESDSMNVADNQNFEEKVEVERFKLSSSMASDEERYSRMCKISLAESNSAEIQTMEVENPIQADIEETLPSTDNKTDSELESTPFLSESKSKSKSKSNPELPSACGNQKWTIGSRRTATDEEELRRFNPREPNYLPLVPDPDAEKVDLRHQMEDERKNSEEWMVDYALRQAITKLAPARKKKVALLVEAFETVIPSPQWKMHLGRTSSTFALARPIQACS